MINLLTDIRKWLSRFRVLLKLRSQYPTSHIHYGVYVDSESRLGRYNALFPRVSIAASMIGDYTYVQQESQIVRAEVGKFCSIGMQVHVGLPQHPLDLVGTHPALYLHNTPLPKTFSGIDRDDAVPRITRIGHDVWIGQRAMLMSGVSIGNGAVIGAGAIVTHDVPDYAVVAGSPARLIRYRFAPEVCVRLSASEWWNMPDDWIERHIQDFQSPLALLDSVAATGGSSTGARACQ